MIFDHNKVERLPVGLSAKDVAIYRIDSHNPNLIFDECAYEIFGELVENIKEVYRDPNHNYQIVLNGSEYKKKELIAPTKVRHSEYTVTLLYMGHREFKKRHLGRLEDNFKRYLAYYLYPVISTLAQVEEFNDFPMNELTNWNDLDCFLWIDVVEKHRLHVILRNAIPPVIDLDLKSRYLEVSWQIGDGQVLVPKSLGEFINEDEPHVYTKIERTVGIVVHDDDEFRAIEYFARKLVELGTDTDVNKPRL